MRVLVPRAAHQARSLIRALEDEKLIPVVIPMIEILPPEKPDKLTAAMAQEYDWVVFTSINAVDAWVGPIHGSVAAIGKATEKALNKRGFSVDYCARPAHSTGFLAHFPSGSGRILLPRANIATDELPLGLQDKGWQVECVEAYRTDAAHLTEDEIKQAQEVDCIAFTSGSTVRSYYQACGAPHPRCTIASIGPKTTAVCSQFGIPVAIESTEATVSALARAIAGYKVT